MGFQVFPPATAHTPPKNRRVIIRLHRAKAHGQSLLGLFPSWYYSQHNCHFWLSSPQPSAPADLTMSGEMLAVDQDVEDQCIVMEWLSLLSMVAADKPREAERENTDTAVQ